MSNFINYLDSLRGRLMVACFNLLGGTVTVLLGAIDGSVYHYFIAAIVYLAAIVNLQAVFSKLKEIE